MCCTAGAAGEGGRKRRRPAAPSDERWAHPCRGGRSQTRRGTARRNACSTAGPPRCSRCRRRDRAGASGGSIGARCGSTAWRRRRRRPQSQRGPVPPCACKPACRTHRATHPASRGSSATGTPLFVRLWRARELKGVRPPPLPLCESDPGMGARVQGAPAAAAKGLAGAWTVRAAAAPGAAACCRGAGDARNSAIAPLTQPQEPCPPGAALAAAAATPSVCRHQTAERRWGRFVAMHAPATGCQAMQARKGRARG